MKKIAVVIVAATMVLPVMTGCGAVTVPETSETEETVAELGPASPKDDFYRYVNEDRLKNAEFEYGMTTVEMAFDQKMIDDQIETIIDDVVAGNGYAAGSEEDIIKRAYDLYMAYDFENEEIPEDLKALIDEIDNASSIDELMAIDAKLVREYGLSGLIPMSPEVDPFDPQRRVMNISQVTGIMNTSFTQMRDSVYAVDNIKEDAEVILSTRGYDKETAEQYGLDLASVALDIYGKTNVDLFEDPMYFQYCKIYTKDQIKSIFTNIDVDAYLTALGYDASKVNAFCVLDVPQLEALNGVLVEKNLNALKTSELGDLYSTYRRYIAPHYSQLASFVGRDYSSEHDQAVTEVSGAFHDETDPLYVERFYTAETDKALRDMCDDIRGGYREIIKNASWLSQATRDELLKKLENIVYVTGTNLERHDNAKYKNLNADNYYDFYMQYKRIAMQDRINSISEPVSRTDIQMPMQMFNACYDPSFNNITITVAITNAPFFDANANYYTNLGGLGMVIAHEMGHAFDSTCILFNSKGEYDPSWISDEDMQTLLARNDQAIRYFEDNFTVFGIYHVDGEQTLGENYADLGAMECITSLTKTQEDREKLFESYATIWCELGSDESIINQIAYDSHSPALVRVNAILSTTEAFYETYGIEEGDGMYIAPEKRISRWY